jgi:hypothetical protein
LQILKQQYEELTPMKVHPTTTLTNKHGDQVEIDTKIAPLVQRLWDMELTTVMSCQGDSGGHVWIMFQSADDAAKFLSLITHGGDAGISVCASRPHSGEGPAALKDTWYVSPYVTTYRNTNLVMILISIRFPRKHLRRVMATLAPNQSGS